MIFFSAASSLRPLSLPALLFSHAVCGGDYGIEDTVGAAGARLTLLGLLVLPWIWSLPIALMTAELGSMIPEAGGYVVWVHRAFGPFWAHQNAVWNLVRCKDRPARTTDPQRRDPPRSPSLTFPATSPRRLTAASPQSSSRVGRTQPPVACAPPPPALPLTCSRSHAPTRQVANAFDNALYPVMFVDYLRYFPAFRHLVAIKRW